MLIFNDLFGNFISNNKNTVIIFLLYFIIFFITQLHNYTITKSTFHELKFTTISTFSFLILFVAEIDNSSRFFLVLLFVSTEPVPSIP